MLSGIEVTIGLTGVRALLQATLLLMVIAICAFLVIVASSQRNLFPTLLYHSAITFQETILGFSFALLLGFILAIILSALPRASAAIWPTILFLQITPKVAIAPLLLVWFGFGELPKIIIAFLIAFFPILSNTISAFRSMEEDIVDLARSMSLPRYKIFQYFMLPQGLPQIFGGLRIAITFAIVGAVVGEFVGSDAGLGYLILVGASTLNNGLLFSSVLSLTLLGIGLYAAVVVIEWITIPWEFARRRAQSVNLQASAIGGGL